MPEEINIDFTENENNKLSVIVKDNKFENFSNIFYAKSTLDCLYNFTKCYKMLIAVHISLLKIADSQELISKVDKHLENFSHLNLEIVKHLNVLENSTEFTKFRKIEKINNLYTINSKNIERLISFIYQLGKIPKQQYDTDVHGGLI
ncbi:MAG: hypothetical protein AABY22_09675 [Nanoarchaeota archaeon]